MGKEYERLQVVKSTTEIPVTPLYVNDMRHGFASDVVAGFGGTGLDYIHCRDPYNFLSGGYSLHFRTRTTGAAEGDSVFTRFAVPTIGWLKHHALFLIRRDHDNPECHTVEFQLRFADVANDREDYYSFRFLGSLVPYYLQVRTAAGWVTVTDMPSMAADLWLPVIAQIDVPNRRWDFVQLQNRVYDFSAYTYWASFGVAVLDQIQITLTATKVPPADLWIDKIVVSGVE